MAQEHATQVGELEVGIFGRMTYHLWRCRDCRRYFAAAEPSSWFDVHVVGLVVRGNPYPKNRRLNNVRRRWADALERGQVCTCEFHAEWPTEEHLHVLLPESQEEDEWWGGSSGEEMW